MASASHYPGVKPPHDLDAEREVLGAVFVDAKTFDVVRSLVRPEDLFVDRHRIVFDAMLGLADKAVPVDLVTTMNELKERGALEKAGGIRTLSELLDRRGTCANVEHYAHIVKRLSYKRQIISLAQSINVDMLSDEDAAAERVERRITQMGGLYGDLRAVGVKRRTWADAVFDTVVRATGEGDKRRRLPFGIPGLDRLLNGGVPDGALVVINALSGGGKTALAVNNLAVETGLGGKRVFIASLEMGDEELVERALARETGIEAWRFDRQAVHQTRHIDVVDAGDKIAALDFVVDETSTSIVEIQARALDAHEEKPVDLVVIDYAQLLHNGLEGEADIAKTSRTAKNLARRLRCPVVLLVQSTVAVNRAKSAPGAADGKGSGALQADADVYIVPHIIEPKDGGERPDECEAEIYVRKQRKGKPGKVTGLVYHGPKCMFMERWI